jgi:uncharacterized protein
MPKHIISSSLALMVSLAVLQPAAAQSFNCRYAKAVDEVAICRSPLLSQLDELMSDIKDNLSGVSRLQIENGQAAWLKDRQYCGGDSGCIENAYRQRIRELLSYSLELKAPKNEPNDY